MDQVVVSILRLGVVEGDGPDHARELALLRETISSRLKTASQADAAFFRQVMYALVALPQHVAPATRAELILDVARYFYIAGLSFEAIEPLKKAELLAQYSNQLPLVHSAANTLGIIYADTGNVSEAIEKHSQALDVARNTGDRAAEAKTWVNLGAALHISADYEN